MSRTIVVTIADLHGGHWLGLCNPATIFLDEDENGDLVETHPSLKPVQQYLWNTCYIEHLHSILDLAGDDEIFLFIDGDLGHGTRIQEHMMRTRVSDLIEIVTWNLVPWMEVPNVRHVRIQVGTSIHNMGEGSLERIVTSKLKEAYPDKDIATHYHSLTTISGVTFDVAHHGPAGGSRKWLEGNVARYYLRDAMYRDIFRGKAPPRVFQRAHHHVWCREWLEVERWESDLVVCPSYCALGAYGHKATQSTPYQTHGCVAYEIRDGELIKVHKKVRTLDLRTKEVF